MFAFFHKRSKSILVYVLFGAIALVFIFFNYYSASTAMGGYAARVNNKTISLSEYKKAVDQMNQYYSRLFGGNMNTNPQQTKYIEQSAMNALVNQIVIADGAQDSGLQVSDAEIKDEIVTIPEFQKEGRFQKDYYLNYLRNIGASPGQFEDQMRRRIADEKVQRFFGQTLVPSDAEVRRSYTARDAKMNLSYATLDTTSAGNVGDKDVADFSNKPDNSKGIEEFFKANPARYLQAEEVHARHILIGFKTGDKGSEDAAKKKIDQIADRVKTEDFGKVAGEVSEDPGSKVKQGDLGYFGKGRMVPEFEKEAFSLANGKISGPVRSPYGFHLIQVLDHKKSETPAFADVKLKVARDLLIEERQKAKRADLEKAVAMGDANAVDKVVKELGMKWQETGMFGRYDETIPKITGAESSAVQIAGLSTEVPVLKQLVANGNTYTVVKLKELKTPAEPKASDLKSVQQEISHSQDTALKSAWGEELRAKARIAINTRLLGAGSADQ